MNIYIKIEILDRELEGRLLLAMAAAERGHDVLLGTMSSLLSHRLWLTPGIYHDKSLTPKPAKVALHARLADAGFAVTSQDEESGLKQPDYAPFARRRFSPQTFDTAAAAFTWGPHDTDALAHAYPDRTSRLHMTGSPRVDLWRPELSGLHGTEAPPGVDPSRPLVLIAPGSIPFRPDHFWTMIADARPRQFKDGDDPREWSHYSTHATAFAYAGRLVRGVRLASHALPDVQFVLRPHPKSPDGVWESLLGPVGDNVQVTRAGSSGRWLATADVIVHNGSTTGVEAAAGGVEVISYQPHGEGTDLFTNRVGQVADGEDTLVALLAAACRTRADGPMRDGRAMDRATATVLAERFAALDGPLAADRIVDVWDGLVGSDRSRPNRVRTSNLLAGLHRRVGMARTSLRRAARPGTASSFTPIDGRGKFPPLDRDVVASTAAGLAASLTRFRGVTVSVVGRHLIHVRPATTQRR